MSAFMCAWFITIFGLVGGVVTLSLSDKPGWGWLLVLLFLMVMGTSYRNKTGAKEEKI